MQYFFYEQIIFTETTRGTETTSEPETAKGSGRTSKSETTRKQEKGNSLIEVLVALSLFSLMTLSTSLLFVSCKILEKKSLWQVYAHSTAWSVRESGYVAKNYPLDFWRLQLQKNFPENEIGIDVTEFSDKKDIQDGDKKMRLKISPKRNTGFSSLEFEF